MISFKFLLENFEIIFQRRLTLVEYNTGCTKKEVFFFFYTPSSLTYFFTFSKNIFFNVSLFRLFPLHRLCSPIWKKASTTRPRCKLSPRQVRDPGVRSYPCRRRGIWCARRWESKLWRRVIRVQRSGGSRCPLVGGKYSVTRLVGLVTISESGVLTGNFSLKFEPKFFSA